ncbi:MAG: LemA family protein [Verrucomicrobiales bacterium]
MNKKIGLGCLALIVLAVLVAGIGGCSSYNRLVGLSEGVDKQWSQVENVYQRRFDLIPNLVRTVEGQAGFEKSTLQEITNARASISQIRLAPGQVPDEATFQQFEKAQAQMGGALSRLIAVAENYPTLRANDGFLALQAELAGTENRITVERMRFNEAAQSYNTSVKRFPTVLFARLMGFSPKPYFRSNPGAEEPPKVEFKFGTKPPGT